MSTKWSIGYEEGVEGFHLFRECFEPKDVHLELSGVDVVCSDGRETEDDWVYVKISENAWIKIVEAWLTSEYGKKDADRIAAKETARQRAQGK